MFLKVAMCFKIIYPRHWKTKWLPWDFWRYTFGFCNYRFTQKFRQSYNLLWSTDHNLVYRRRDWGKFIFREEWTVEEMWGWGPGDRIKSWLSHVSLCDLGLYEPQSSQEGKDGAITLSLGCRGVSIDQHLWRYLARRPPHNRLIFLSYCKSFFTRNGGECWCDWFQF